MNKPAPKEPSMDEILSSIRQIIADDDAAGAPKKPAGLGASPLVSPAPPIRPALGPRPVAPAPEPEPEAETEPLALSPEQIVETPEPAAGKALSFDEIMGGAAKAAQPSAFAAEPQLVDPEDVAFESDPEPEPEPEEDPMAMFSVEMDEPEPVTPAPEPIAARPAYVPPPMPRPAPRPQPSVAQTAPMPDPQLSSDMAEQLLDQTTQSAVKSTFNKLNGLSMAGSGVTLEAMMRDMLRPMLKEWLDENLPAVVERMVEREIARISRGGE
ncbi:MAG TPA: DUF2497 domain-containing protein [Devosia sp.]